MMNEDKLVEIFQHITNEESILYLLSYCYLFDDCEDLNDEDNDFMDKVNPDMKRAIEEFIPSIIGDDELIAGFMLAVRAVLKL